MQLIKQWIMINLKASITKAGQSIR